jgi:predicted AAA+ superfamily ATPase
MNTLNLIFDGDLPSVHNMEYASVYKLKKLMYMLASLGPYKPDITKLAGQLEMSRNYVLKYLDYLKDAQLLNLLKTDDGGESYLTKPEKVYLNNTNLAFALGTESSNVGSFREIFFFNQMNYRHKVSYSEMGDFMLNDNYIFEVGGKKKSFNQIKNEPNAFVVADETEMGYGNKIPLWLFGMTY